MTISTVRKMPDIYFVKGDLKTILGWIPKWNSYTKQQNRPTGDAITIEQIINVANLSESFQEMTLRKKHIDPLNISKISSAILPQKTLESLVDQEDELNGFDFLTEDPGIYLLRKWTRPFSTVKRKVRLRWIVMDDVTEMEEAFTCAGRFAFFETWQWLFPVEFKAARDEMKALAAKHNWPILF